MLRQRTEKRKKQRAGKKKEDGFHFGGEDKVKEGGQTLVLIAKLACVTGDTTATVNITLHQDAREHHLAHHLAPQYTARG